MSSHYTLRLLFSSCGGLQLSVAGVIFSFRFGLTLLYMVSFGCFPRPTKALWAYPQNFVTEPHSVYNINQGFKKKKSQDPLVWPFLAVFWGQSEILRVKTPQKMFFLTQTNFLKVSILNSPQKLIYLFNTIYQAFVFIWDNLQVGITVWSFCFALFENFGPFLAHF